MKLKDIFAPAYRSLSPQDFLEKKQEENRKVCNALCARVRAQKENRAFVEKTLERAEEAMRGLFILPGTGGKLFDVGTPPAWKECRGESEEYLFVLARMGWFSDLCNAYLITGEERYAQKALDDMTNFVDTCPPPDPARANDPDYLKAEFCMLTPWRQLEVGIRMFDSWYTLYRKLLLSPLMTAQIHEKFALSVWQHCRQLCEVSPILWPTGAHNHFLHEMLGLLRGVSLFPEFDRAQEWTKNALDGLELSAVRQFAEDGAQIEGSPGYHNLSVSMLLAAYRTAAECGLDLSEVFRERTRLALVYGSSILRPDGDISTIGDSPKCERFTGEIAYGYYGATGGFGPYQNAVGLLKAPSFEDPITPEEYERALAQSAPAGAELHAFPSVGQIFGRTGYGRSDSWFSFVCHTPIYNGHAHIDPLSVELILGGREILLDPSYFTYAEIPERKIFKSSTYHNCLNFGDREPFDYAGQWLYTPQKRGDIAHAYESDGLLGGDGSHDNYLPDEHRRLVALIGDDCFAILDDVKNETEEDIRLWFHTPLTGLSLTEEGAAADGIRFLLPACADAGTELLPSRRSYDHDIAEPSMRLAFRDRAPGRAPLYFTLITTAADVCEPQAERDGDGRVLFSFRKGGKIMRFRWTYGEELVKI